MEYSFLNANFILKQKKRRFLDRLEGLILKGSGGGDGGVGGGGGGGEGGVKYIYPHKDDVHISVNMINV